MIYFSSIYQKGIMKTRDINWHNMTLSFDGMTKLFLNRLLNNLLNLAKSKTESAELEGKMIKSIKVIGKIKNYKSTYQSVIYRSDNILIHKLFTSFN